MKEVFIIGAGVLGLSAALDLIERDWKVHLIEASAHLGGLAQSQTLDGVLIDRFYHFYYWNDHQFAHDFLKQAGVKNETFWKAIRTSTYVNGKFVNFDSAFQVLRLAGKGFHRVVWTLLKLKFMGVPISLDNENAIDWARRAFGPGFANSVWVPLLVDKFGHHAKEISAFWLATRIKRHLSTKVGFPPRSRFGYLVSTYEPTFRAVVEKIKATGGSISLGDRISKLSISDGRIDKIIFESDREIEIGSRTILTTVPLARLKHFFEPLPQELKYLQTFQLVGVVLVTLSLKKKLSEDYWTTVSSDAAPFTVIIQQNRLYPKSDKELVYLSRYSELGAEIFRRSKEAIFAEFFTALQNIYPHITLGDVGAYDVSVSEAAAPVPTQGSLVHTPGFESPYPRFYHAGFEQIFPEDRGVGNSVRIGHLVADAVSSAK